MVSKRRIYMKNVREITGLDHLHRGAHADLVLSEISRLKVEHEK